jgi:hypothetical protein
LRINRLKSLLAKTSGSIVVEASLILPVFLSFVLVLNSFIQITIAQIALQTAVSETTKQIATHMYPVKLLYSAAESKITGSQTGKIIQQVLQQIEEARSKVTGSEDLVEQYASYIPQSIVLLLEWEKQQREHIEANGQDISQQMLDRTFNPLLNQAFTDLVLQFADNQVLRPNNLKVVAVQLPNLVSSEALIAIEAEYDVQLNLPFFHRTLALRKRAVERVWIGS